MKEYNYDKERNYLRTENYGVWKIVLQHRCYFLLNQMNFWERMRRIIREEVSKSGKEPARLFNDMSVSRFDRKPLYKIQEICSLFKVTKPTIYD